MYEKPYKVLTSSSGKVEPETQVEEANDQRSAEFNHSPIKLEQSKMKDQIEENRVKLLEPMVNYDDDR